MKLYFGNAVTTATTMMILALLGFIGYCGVNSADIRYWGRRSAALLVLGLVVCCFAAARDGFDKTIQYAIDGSGAPGVFPTPPHQCACCCRLYRRCLHRHCSHCHAGLQNAENARSLVYRDVRRGIAESCSYRNCSDIRLIGYIIIKK